MPEREAYRDRRLATAWWPADTSRDLLDWTIGTALRTAAEAAPERTALVEGTGGAARRRRWSYRELLTESERVATALLQKFRPGERVAVWAPNMPEWELLLYGCALAGVVMVTINPAYKASELAHVLGKSGAAGLFLIGSYRGFDTADAAAQLRPRLPELREIVRLEEFADFVAAYAGDTHLPDVRPEDPALIMFTSGTTGVQKGVVCNHLAIVNMTRFTLERAGLAVGGTYVNPMPMFHIGALAHAGVGAVVHQATHVLACEWDPALYLTLVEEEGGTFALLVPTMIEALLALPDLDRHDVSTFRNLCSGASMVEADLIRRTKAELGSSICILYGQTEMSGVSTAAHCDDGIRDQSETVGQPLPHVEMKIADLNSGDVMPVGMEGEICIRGYQVMLGYFAMPEETRKAVDADGWLHSGDLGAMDERGFVRISGRLKDLIIRGGENIYPREIENLLLTHPDVAEAAVIGIPDRRWGEEVGAVIVARLAGDGPRLQELRSLCRENLAGFKVPKFWYFSDELPRTETGKIQKFKLVEAVQQGVLSATMA